jgi:hypothetical protein
MRYPTYTEYFDMIQNNRNYLCRTRGKQDVTVFVHRHDVHVVIYDCSDENKMTFIFRSVDYNHLPYICETLKTVCNGARGKVKNIQTSDILLKFLKEYDLQEALYAKLDGSRERCIWWCEDVESYFSL